MENIQLKLSLPGLDGLDEKPDNSPSRAFSALMKDGKHHKSQTFCFLKTSEEINPTKWLGVFLFTAGDRILFFPGLENSIDWIEKNTIGSSPIKQDFKLDHFTVEPSRQRWHFTTFGSTNHIAGGRTPNADSNSYLWMGISVPNYQTFSSLYKQTYVTHKSPKSDSERRLELLRKLEDFTTHTYINIDQKSNTSPQPTYLHFCILFCKPSAKTYEGPEWLIPEKSPYLNTNPPYTIPTIRLHKFPLSPNWQIQIATMELPGVISRSAIFTTLPSIQITL